MNEIFLDTETTGLNLQDGHRIIEIACIETKDLIPTEKIFHVLLNPDRKVSEDAIKVHGYTDEFLKDKKSFKDIASEFLNFITGKKLIIHNAPFDLSFLNNELKNVGKKSIDNKNVIDTLELARSKFPGTSNSLNNLCKKFNIDISRRKKHNALLDCELLREVYINLTEQKEPSLILNEISGSPNILLNEKKMVKDYSKIVVIPDENESLNHKAFLKRELKKNYF